MNALEIELSENLLITAVQALVVLLIFFLLKKKLQLLISSKELMNAVLMAGTVSFLLRLPAVVEIIGYSSLILIFGVPIVGIVLSGILLVLYLAIPPAILYHLLKTKTKKKKFLIITIILAFLLLEFFIAPQVFKFFDIIELQKLPPEQGLL
jgi:hypothetical protein